MAHEDDLTLGPDSEELEPPEPQRKKRLRRINTPHKMALWIERMLYEVHDAIVGSLIFQQAEATSRLMRLLREIHADEILAKRQKELEERILTLQDRLDAAERRGRMVQ